MSNVKYIVYIVFLMLRDGMMDCMLFGFEIEFSFYARGCRWGGILYCMYSVPDSINPKLLFPYASRASISTFHFFLRLIQHNTLQEMTHCRVNIRS